MESYFQISISLILQCYLNVIELVSVGKIYVTTVLCKMESCKYFWFLFVLNFEFFSGVFIYFFFIKGAVFNYSKPKAGDGVFAHWKIFHEVPLFASEFLFIYLGFFSSVQILFVLNFWNFLTRLKYRPEFFFAFVYYLIFLRCCQRKITIVLLSFCEKYLAIKKLLYKLFEYQNQKKLHKYLLYRVCLE